MLTDTACKKATCPPDKKRHRLADYGGLYLEVSPSGSKRWFWKYRFQSKEELSGSTGIDPAQLCQLEKLANQLDADVFASVARKFHKIKFS